MARRTGTSRVEGGPQRAEPRLEPTLPSMRERRPVMFWVVVLAVAAMVLSTFASFLSVVL